MLHLFHLMILKSNTVSKDLRVFTKEIEQTLNQPKEKQKYTLLPTNWQSCAAHKTTS